MKTLRLQHAHGDCNVVCRTSYDVTITRKSVGTGERGRPNPTKVLFLGGFFDNVEKTPKKKTVRGCAPQ